MLWLLIPLIGGCDRNTDRADIPSPYTLFISTNKTDYERNERTVITIFNNTDQTVVFDRCHSDIFYYRDKWVENQWIEWTSLSCSDTALSKLILTPHTSVSDSIIVRKPGEYRFRYPIHWNDDQNTPDTVVSTSFIIH